MVFLAAKWLQEFEILGLFGATFDWTFKSNETIQAEVLWNMWGNFKYVLNGDFPGVSYAELPYLHKELTFGIILPEKYDGIDELDHNVSIDMYEALISEARHLKNGCYGMSMVMPKFKIETTCSLKEALQNTGMTNLFENMLTSVCRAD